MHSTASDGKHTVEEMAETARQLGHEYIAMTDHSKSVTIANGLDEKRVQSPTSRSCAPSTRKSWAYASWQAPR